MSVITGTDRFCTVLHKYNTQGQEVTRTSFVTMRSKFEFLSSQSAKEGPHDNIDLGDNPSIWQLWELPEKLHHDFMQANYILTNMGRENCSKALNGCARIKSQVIMTESLSILASFNY